MKRYRALAFVSALYKVLGFLVIIGGIVGAAILIVTGMGAPGGVGAIIGQAALSVVSGIVGGLFLIAIGQVWELMIDLANNTRQTEANIRALGKLIQRQQTRSAGPMDSLSARSPARRGDALPFE